MTPGGAAAKSELTEFVGEALILDGRGQLLGMLTSPGAVVLRGVLEQHNLRVVNVKDAPEVMG